MGRTRPRNKRSIMIFYDDFLDHIAYKFEAINKAKAKGDKKEVAKLKLEVAKYKVDYYSTANKDSYNQALLELADARDECMDLGIFEE